jgi:hypothetical protein
MSVLISPVRPPRARFTTTPWLLRGALAAVVLLAGLFGAAVTVGADQHYRAMKKVGKDTAPSILAAQQIKAGLADMHANAANMLLQKPGRGGKDRLAAYGQAAKDYDQRRREVSEGLLAAGENITEGDRERVPLKRLLNGLGRYEAQVAEALALHARGLDGPLEHHRAADRLMHESLLPAADALDGANRDALDRTYEGAQAANLRALLGVLATGAALLAALLASQVFLARRMRRLLNPGLALATALAASFLAYTVVALLDQQRALRVAKQDAFDSVHHLWRARAVAYDANGDESRWLLDRERAKEHETAFREKRDRIAKPPPGLSFRQLEAAVAAAGAKADLPKGLEGYLADELNNVTFPGEWQAAVACVGAFVAYLDVDEQIRALEKGGRHDEAVALCLGTRPGESNWAFEQFNKALGDTIEINQREFEKEVERGLAMLGWFPYTAPLAALGVALLAFLGLLPRLREYAAP